MLNKLIILILLIISMIVSAGLARGQNMWLWIVLYWTVLTVKNLYDLLCGKEATNGNQTD